MVLFLHITIEICRWLLRSKNHDRAPPADFTKVFHKRMAIFLLVFTKGEKTNTFYSNILTDLTEIILVLNGDLFQMCVQLNPPFVQMSCLECS